MDILVMSQVAGRLPKSTEEFYEKLSDVFVPDVIYDIGSAVAHFSELAQTLWPKARIIMFEANDMCEMVYTGKEYHMGLLSNKDGEEKKYWVSEEHFGGNSYYKERDTVITGLDSFKEYIPKKTITLSTAVKNRKFPLPDLVKIDTQGSEMDIIQGGEEIIKNAKVLIVEIQHEDYNEGAPKHTETIPYIESLGFVCVKVISPTRCDADYLFVKKGFNLKL